LRETPFPERIRAKNSLHQIDFFEALTLCQAMDKVPEAVIVGVEPEDIRTLKTELTETTKNRMEDVIRMVFSELQRLGITYSEKGTDRHVSRNPF
jgi:hydrogenase maturation protease